MIYKKCSFTDRTNYALWDSVRVERDQKDQYGQYFSEWIHYCTENLFGLIGSLTNK